MKIDPLFLHDLRAPLARARTYGKLLQEDSTDAELLKQLLLALEDLDERLKSAEENSSSGS